MLDAVVLGTFDGLHSGHRAVLDSVKEYRRIALTFKSPPKAILSGKKELLMTPEDKYQALCDYGVDEVYMPDFSEMRHLSPIEFLEHIKKKYKPEAIACGFNYRFGLNAEGDVELLKKYTNENGIRLFCTEPVKKDGVAISSSNIRNLILNGNMSEANFEIYGGFGFTAEVIHGDHRGRTIGFPTINQIYPVCLVRPKFGVYASEVLIDKQKFSAITNVGFRPTYKTPMVTTETHIPHFLGDLYGKRIRINFKKFLREEKRFNSLEELKEAINGDVSEIFG